MRRQTVAVALLGISLLLSACAGVPESPAAKAEAEQTNDPWEPVNRVVFDVNDFLDRLLFRPLAELYRDTIPPGIRDRVAGIVGNMKEPVIFANDVMQGEMGKAGTTVERFSINTTIGIGGMWDWAGQWGMYQQTGDFGQTLASWGVGDGPYIVIPFYGPSDVRDGIGMGVDMAMSPWQYLADMGSTATSFRFEVASFAGDGIVRREQNIEGLDALRAGSLDYYAQMRSVYRQYRTKQIGNEPTQNLPKFEDYE